MLWWNMLWRSTNTFEITISLQCGSRNTDTVRNLNCQVMIGGRVNWSAWKHSYWIKLSWFRLHKTMRRTLISRSLPRSWIAVCFGSHLLTHPCMFTHGKVYSPVNISNPTRVPSQNVSIKLCCHIILLFISFIHYTKEISSLQNNINHHLSG